MPDWLLSQIFVVSKISAVKIKLLAKLVLQQARGEAIDEGKLAKLLGDGKLELHEVKAVVAALHFILASSARFDVSEEQLTLELQQLGLPNEHTEPLMLALHNGRAAMLQHLSEISLRLPRVTSLRWRVVEDLGSARAHALDLQLTVRDQPHAASPGWTPSPSRVLRFQTTPHGLTFLQAELRAAREVLPTEEQPQG